VDDELLAKRGLLIRSIRVSLLCWQIPWRNLLSCPWIKAPRNNKIIGKAGVSINDIDDYLSANSRYFATFRCFMQPATRIETLAGGTLTLARETYWYYLGLERWLSHLDSLGFSRLSDEERSIDLPWSPEEMIAKVELGQITEPT
jgi:hypothetical protein